VVGAEARLIDESVAWNIAREVVLASTDARLPKLNLSVNTITERGLQFEHAIHDHLSSFDTARTALKQRARILELPYNDAALARGSHDGKTYADVRKIVTDAEQTEVIADLARAYNDEKRAHGVMEFSDQVAHAL